MAVTILMSGPIRPSESDVLANIGLLRRQFPESRIFLSTWTESPAIRAAVDFCDVCPEPPAPEIRRLAPHETRCRAPHTEIPDTYSGGRLSMFKMVYGVERACLLARPYLSDSDLVMRVRTDSFCSFDPIYFQSLLKSLQETPSQYITKHGHGSDWFGLSSFKYFRQTWIFRDLEEYNQAVREAWNPEQLILNRAPVPVTTLDYAYINMYVLRPTGEKLYIND